MKLLTALIVLLVCMAQLSACAIYYRDDETGAEHIWGIGHLATKITEPLDKKQAVIRQATLTGLSVGIEDESFGFSLGWDQRERIHIYDENTSFSIKRPEDGNYFLFKFGTEPLRPGPFTNANDKRITP